MRWLVTALPALACGAMMLVMCVPMLLRRNKATSEAASEEDIAALREEIALLKAERALDGVEDQHV
ncbi:MAG: hypothetical protein ACRDLB_01025 [Actinomycetota bacterium]